MKEENFLEEKFVSDRLIKVIESDRDYFKVLAEQNRLQLEEMRRQRSKDKRDKRIMLLIIVFLSFLIPVIFLKDFSIELGVRTQEVRIECSPKAPDFQNENIK